MVTKKILGDIFDLRTSKLCFILEKTETYGNKFVTPFNNAS